MEKLLSKDSVKNLSVSEMIALQKIMPAHEKFKKASISEVIENCIYNTGFYDCKVDGETLLIQEQGTLDRNWYKYEIPTKIGAKATINFGTPAESQKWEILHQVFTEFGGAELREGVIYFSN